VVHVLPPSDGAKGKLGIADLKEGSHAAEEALAEGIVAKLRQADVLLAQGQTGAEPMIELRWLHSAMPSNPLNSLEQF